MQIHGHVRRWRSAAFALLMVAGTTAVARAETWRVDPSHSKVSFKIRHLMISNVEGRFTKFDASIQGDPGKPESAVVMATIDASSINTDDPKRDDHLRSPDFFEVAKYPTITFKSKAIRNWKESSFEVVGDLTMHGVTKEVVLAVTDLTPEIKDPWGNAKRGMTATATLDRTDYGIVWNKALEAGGVTVGNDVKITIELEIKKDKDS
ncbi:MAG: YceI family protein [bacterium]